ncbi:hypothetical protein DIPPA_34978 [Diplonema papillatum]|nr:hypothetical protein DIPPA_34978 [Diplonema papillatum]
MSKRRRTRGKKAGPNTLPYLFLHVRTRGKQAKKPVAALLQDAVTEMFGDASAGEFEEVAAAGESSFFRVQHDWASKVWAAATLYQNPSTDTCLQVLRVAATPTFLV